MNRTVFLLMCAISLSVSSSIRASQSGKSAHKVLACMNPGCAANVTHVYCNNELIFNKADIPDCKSILEPMKVCKSGGRAFVNTTGDCEFEGDSGHIDKYPGGDAVSLYASEIVELQNQERPRISSEDMTAHTTSSPTSSDDLAGKIVGGVFGSCYKSYLLLLCPLLCLGNASSFAHGCNACLSNTIQTKDNKGGVGLVVLLGWITHFCLKRRNKRQSREPTDERAETVALRDVRTAGENGEREAAGGPGLDDDNPPPQPDHGR